MNKHLFSIIKYIYNIPRRIQIFFLKMQLGKCGNNIYISFPCRLSVPRNVFIGDFVLIQGGATFIMNKGRVYFEKWASIGSNVTIITDNHVPTVGVNHRFLGKYHINDRVKDIHIGEECWVGAGVTIMNGARMGRGSVAAACALVNKDVPPYAVVAGVPARIIASLFTMDEIIEHEKYLYPVSERMSLEELSNLFDSYFVGKRSIGIKGIKSCDLNVIEDCIKMQYKFPLD